MMRKFRWIVGIVMMLSLIPNVGDSQTTTNEKTEEHHTAVKRTYNKAKHKVKKTWHKTKSATSKEYNKVKNRVSTDDEKRDAQERK